MKTEESLPSEEAGIESVLILTIVGGDAWVFRRIGGVGGEMKRE